MKYLLRYLSLLFVLVMSLGLFCVPVSAEQLDLKEYHIYSTVGAYGNANTVGGYDTFTFYPTDGISMSLTTESSAFTFSLATNVYFKSTYSIAYDDSTLLFSDTGKVKVTLRNLGEKLKVKHFYSDSTTKMFYHDNTSEVIVVAYYSDSSTENFNGSINYVSNGKFDLLAEFTPKKDVVKLAFSVSTKLTNSVLANYAALLSDGVTYKSNAVCFTGEINSDPISLTIDQQSEEAGLLAGVWNAITDVWRTCEAGFANLVQGIKDLPGKIWSFFEEGLKGLFVPSEETMVSYKDKWDQLLSDRLGAVYQVVNILTDSWDGVMNADQTNTIEFPSATINLPGNESFTFGGYTIEIVPQGFDFLATAIKTIVGIVCTIAFVNGLRKRYDEIMGVEQ